jgi:hypothetical protein
MSARDELSTHAFSSLADSSIAKRGAGHAASFEGDEAARNRAYDLWEGGSRSLIVSAGERSRRRVLVHHDGSGEEVRETAPPIVEQHG